MDQDQMTSSAPSEPHFTDCTSRDQVTFRCWWSPGKFHNVSSPGSLRVFYRRKESKTEWLSRECPEYIHSNRECYFDANHTQVWTAYCMELRSQNATYLYDEKCFTVENIVRPDPPVSLNWTLLDISPSGLNYDVMVNWEPPPTADIKGGWMQIVYELHYRDRNTTNWETLETLPHTKHTIYGLKVGKEYEVHIRSRMPAFTRFGGFSDPIYIHVVESPIEGDSAFSLTLAIIFGAVGILVLIMFIVVSQQHRLMMILLPPVPAPKIKGIDSQMLKKGKLDELNFILGGLPTYGPDFYQDEPWVEVIEVGAEDPDAEGKGDSQVSDTQWLLGLPHPAVHHMNNGCSNVISFPNAESNHAGCCDPGVSSQDTLMLMATLLPGQAEDEEDSSEIEERASAPDSSKTSCSPQTGGPQTWINTDFYAQVSNVMPSGGVVLSPGQQLKTVPVGEEKAQDSKDSEEEVEEKQTELQFQLLVVDPEDGCYTAESSVRQFDTGPCSPPPDEGRQAAQAQPLGTKPAAKAESSSQSPYVLPGSPQTQNFAPLADYTVVQEFDLQHSLLLNPTSHSSPPPCTPQHPLKALPAMPVGYVTPDLLGNISP